VTERLIATLRVPAGDPVFAGHFPGRPIVPGVMLLDWTLRELALALGCGSHSLRIREGKFFATLQPDELAELCIDDSGGRWAYRIRHAGVLLASGVVEKPGD
jgi:3-hydroxymyristoyl/3-hydroxydecanoyl-(acyl carrier protein) dehydratase